MLTHRNIHTIRQSSFQCLPILLLLMACPYASAQDTATIGTTGRDFWLMFLDNRGDQTPHHTFINVVGDSNATINVSNPSTNWTTSATLTANQSVQISVPVASSSSSQSNTPQTKNLGLHLTSTTPVSVTAMNHKLKCNDIALILPTHMLGTRYILQDYTGSSQHSDISNTVAGFVATLDNTTLTMVLPCNLIGNSAHAGDTLTVNLMQGQSYQLIASPSSSFSGMEVTSNGKPFAAFQGNRAAYIPTAAQGADLLYEQALPVDHWGTDYVVVPTYGRSGDQVRITSAEDNCQLYRDGTLLATLQKGDTYEESLTTTKRYTTTGKIAVGRYLRSNSSGGSPGDPASVMIPPTSHGSQHIRFATRTESEFSNHYVNIVAPNSCVTTITLDGSNIANRFQQLDTTYSYATVPLSQGTHSLDSPQGSIVADLYGLGNVAAYATLLAYTICRQPEPESLCSSSGNDFWMTYFYNYHQTASYNPGRHDLLLLGNEDCIVNITKGTNPLAPQTLTIGNNLFAAVTVGDNNSLPVATPYNGGYHITSSSNIWLYANNYIRGTQDVATVMPSHRLDTTYIVQDYPSWEYGAQVAFVATEDNTVLTMTVPCRIQGTSIAAGTVLNPTLQRGQAYLLVSDGVGSSFSGMKVTSNGKPFAMFQGGRRITVPSTGSGSDLLYDQAIPPALWGTQFVVAGAKGQSGSNYVRITAAQNNCVISVNNNPVSTINQGQTFELPLPTASVLPIATSSPACVVLYLTSHATAGSSGDPSAIPIPPIDNGIQEARFVSINSQEITPNNHHINIICDTAWASHLTLDGNPLPSSDRMTTVGPYSVWRHTLQPGDAMSNHWLHHMENSHGPFVAYTYGLGYYESYGYSLGFGCGEPPEEQQACQRGNGQGRDFWATFLCNDDDPANSALSLIATGAQQASVTVTNPVTGWTQTASMPAGGKVQINLPVASTIPSGQTHNIGYHITSTAPVTLYACNFKEGSWDFAQVFPTFAIGDNYIVQNYTNNSDHPANVAFVATENGTSLSMVLPCTVTGLSLPAGSQYTATLDSGQSLMLRANPGGDFSGMEVSSNCKPFALFQGCAAGRVGDNGTNSGRDHFFEQALSPAMWGTEFVADASLNRSEGDRVVVTAGADNCTVQINGSIVATLMRGQSHEHTLASNTTAHIITSQPAYACLYLVSYHNGGTRGDPGAATLPPVNRWVCHSDFMLHQCNNNPSSQYYIANPYINIIAENTAVGTLALDGTVIPASLFSPIAGTSFSHTRKNIDYGAHTLDGGDAGTFSARAYGLGQWVGFAYNIDMLVDTMERCLPQLHHDTITYSDTVCQSQEYRLPASFTVDGQTYTPPLEGLIYIRASETAQPGTLQRESNWVQDDTLVHHIHLTLTILASTHDTLTSNLIAGDTLLFADTAITLAGTYTFRYTAQNGCDSVVTLIVGYEAAGLTASADGLCPGEEVTLTATGTHTFIWSASPADPSLDTLQGQNPVSVHPSQTTTYSLLDAAGSVIASITVGVEPPPTLCIESNRTFIDFDYPVLSLHDCSTNRHHTSWSFSDGATLSGERARRLFHHPLPDSVSVTMTSCNSVNCCADTTVVFVTKIRSVWFPNIFFPDQASNNRFGCHTSFEVQDFEMTVYNRQGLLVWQSDDINVLWDGTHDGTPVPQGAYVYRWYLTDIYGDRRNGIGTVTLIR